MSDNKGTIAWGKTGGGSALDGIDGTGLTENHFAHVFSDDVGHDLYRVRLGTGATPDGDTIIQPATNPGTALWYKQTGDYDEGYLVGGRIDSSASILPTDTITIKSGKCRDISNTYNCVWNDLVVSAQLPFNESAETWGYTGTADPETNVWANVYIIRRDSDGKIGACVSATETIPVGWSIVRLMAILQCVISLAFFTHTITYNDRTITISVIGTGHLVNILTSASLTTSYQDKTITFPSNPESLEILPNVTASAAVTVYFANYLNNGSPSLSSAYTIIGATNVTSGNGEINELYLKTDASPVFIPVFDKTLIMKASAACTVTVKPRAIRFER